MAWNPREEPYRVLVTRRSNQYGLHGWKSDAPKTFATLEQAQAFYEQPQGRSVISVCIHKAVNPSTWQLNGRWQLVAKRKA